MFGSALLRVPSVDRDAWVDVVFGLDSLPDDDPSLPRGCVPYLPCPVDAVLRIVQHAAVQPHDVFVDVGSGVGRAAALVHLLTGASVIGIEIQRGLVRASRELMTRLSVTRFAAIEADAAPLARFIASGTVFFLYCPFGGERLEALLGGLEDVARAREIRVCCVDMPPPSRPWLGLVSAPAVDVAVYRSTLHGESTDPGAQGIPGNV